MTEIVIQKGVYGLRTGVGRAKPIARGEKVSVSEEEAVRLVGLGVAACADTPAVASVPPPDGSEPQTPSTDTPGENRPAQAATGGESGNPDEGEVAKLERMPKADLERMAMDLGVDVSGAKNNRERAMLIAAAETSESGETPPELDAGDIVQ